MRCHPARWLWGLIPVAMLSWLAVQVEHNSIEADLEHRSAAALAAAGHDWAVVAFDGRDGLLAGRSSGEHQREEAVALVSGVWGVRTVRTRSDAPASPDVPLNPAPSLPPLERTLDDQAPEAVVSDLAPDGAAHVSPEAAQSIAVASSESLRAATGHARDAVPASAAALPTVPTREVPPATTAAPDMELPAQKPADAAASEQPAPVATAAAAQVPDIPVPKPSPPAQTEGPQPNPAAPLSTLHPPEERAASAAAEPAPSPAATAEADTTKADTSKTDTTKVDTVAALPERKPASPPAAAEPYAKPLTKVTEPEQAPASHSAAPPARRFETAALPPGNIASAAACLDDVRAAAQRVEVHFARGDARFDPPGKSLIDGLISALQLCPEAVVRIAGHADASGKARHNQMLSRHRARGVASYMNDKGIDAGRLVAIGYGDKRPVAPNDTQANRARNRRIELTVTARAAPVPPMPIRKQGTRNGLSRR